MFHNTVHTRTDTCQKPNSYHCKDPTKAAAKAGHRRVDVCDGAGFLADFLAKHKPPPQLTAQLRVHTTTAQAAPNSSASGTQVVTDVRSCMRSGDSAGDCRSAAAALCECIHRSLPCSSCEEGSMETETHIA